MASSAAQVTEPGKYKLEAPLLHGLIYESTLEGLLLQVRARVRVLGWAEGEVRSGTRLTRHCSMGCKHTCTRRQARQGTRAGMWVGMGCGMLPLTMQSGRGAQRTSPTPCLPCAVWRAWPPLHA